MQRSTSLKLYDGKGLNPSAGSAAYGGRPRRQNRSEYPHACADPGRSGYCGGCGIRAGEVLAAYYYNRYGNCHDHRRDLPRAKLRGRIAAARRKRIAGGLEPAGGAAAGHLPPASKVIDRIREEFPGQKLSVVATGGNAPVIVRYCRNPIIYDKYLLMDGLWTIYQKNR